MPKLSKYKSTMEKTAAQREYSRLRSQRYRRRRAEEFEALMKAEEQEFIFDDSPMPDMPGAYRDKRGLLVVPRFPARGKGALSITGDSITSAGGIFADDGSDAIFE